MREIRSRIKSVKSTQQITKAMNMVSVAKLRRAQKGTEGMQVFSRECREVLGYLLSGHTDHPFLTPRPEIRHSTYVLFVGNRGLCGNYNTALVRYMQELLEGAERPASVIVVGRWGRDVLAASGLPIRATYADFGDTPAMEDAVALAELLKRMYLDGETDQVYLVYQHFETALVQTPASLRLLPSEPAGDPPAGETEYLFEPSKEAVLDSAVQLFINSTVFSVLQEARAGEQAARMTAMTAATDATADLIDQLSLDLNRARQAAITTEISEIVGGANALKNKDDHSS